MGRCRWYVVAEHHQRYRSNNGTPWKRSSIGVNCLERHTRSRKQIQRLPIVPNAMQAYQFLSQKIGRGFFHCNLCLLAHRSCCMCAETTHLCVTPMDSEYQLSIFFVHATNEPHGQFSNVFNYIFFFFFLIQIHSWRLISFITLHSRWLVTDLLHS